MDGVDYWLELSVGDVWTMRYTGNNNITLKMTAIAAETCENLVNNIHLTHRSAFSCLFIHYVSD